MELRRQRRALSLLYRVFVRGSTDGTQIPYTPQKLRIAKRAEAPSVRVRPEEIGLSSSYLRDFLEALESDRGIALHTLSISRWGKPFLAVAAPGYDLSVRHLTHSVCKTVTGLAVGLLLDEGKLSLDTPLYTLFPDKLSPLYGGKSRLITIRHLLSMSSGVPFAETGSVTSEDWIRSFFDAVPTFTPGTGFAYNSMNSYMLSAVIERITKQSLPDYLRPRLFEPLGIDDIVWERCPRGITKGGWGLYLAPGDMLKLGELILSRGMYKGRRLIPAKWIDEMCRPHKATPEKLGPYSYGYQIWVAEDGKSLLCNGMLGQNIWICPENGIVLCCNAGNCELYQQGNLLPLVREYFSRPFPPSLKKDRRGYRRLRRVAESFFATRTFTKPYHAPHHEWHGRGFPKLLSTLPNTTFVAAPNNFGLLPVFVMLMQNSLNQGIHSIHMGVFDKKLYAYIKEGNESYRIGIGFSDFVENVVTVRGESYLLRARGEFCDDTDGFPVFKMEFIFPELPCARRIKLYYAEKEPFMVLSEQPGQGILDGILDNLSVTMKRGDFWADLLRSRMEKEWLAYRIRMSFEQKLKLGRGKRPSLPNPVSIEEMEEGFETAFRESFGEEKTKKAAPKRKGGVKESAARPQRGKNPSAEASLAIAKTKAKSPAKKASPKTAAPTAKKTAAPQKAPAKKTTDKAP